MARKALLIVIVLPVVVAAVAGCAAGPVRSPRPGPDWSRGVMVGTSPRNDPVALYPEPDGQRVHLSWGEASSEGDRVRYVQLDGEGTAVVDEILPLAAASPHRARLLPDGHGGLILCYLSGISEKRRLYTARLDGEGRVLGGPLEVSGLDLEVNAYEVVATPTGPLVFWGHVGRSRRGLYQLRLDQAGAPVGESRLMVEDGIDPRAQVDRDGRVHLTWVQEPGYYEENIYYATFDPATQALSRPVRVGYFALSPKATRHGPVLALSGERVYVIWSWQFLAPGGLYFGSASRAGEGECHYVCFPPDAPDGAEEEVLALSPNPRPTYLPAQGAYAYTRLAVSRGWGGELVPEIVVRVSPRSGMEIDHVAPVFQDRSDPGGAGSSLVTMPCPAPAQEDEAALAVSLQTSTRTRTQVQLAVVYLGNEGPKGYQLAARSEQVLIRPVLMADQQRHLHLAWLEPAGFGAYRVFYAGSREATRAALGRFGRDDVIDGAYKVGWALVQSASLFPVGLVWLFLPFVWVIGYYLVKVEGGLDRVGPRIALAVAMLLYVFGKFFVMPAGFIEAAPFMDRLPASMAEAYMFALPAAILLAAVGAFWLYLRRSVTGTLLAGYLVFGLTDCVLTFLLYAPGVLG